MLAQHGNFMNFNELKLGTRIALGYGLLLVFLIAIAGLGIYGMKQSQNALENVVKINDVKTQLTIEMADAVHKVTRVTRTLALLEDKALFEIEKKKIGIARAKYNEVLTTLEKMPLNAEGKKILGEIKAEQVIARAANDQFLEMESTNRAEATKFLLNVASPANVRWMDNLNAFINLQKLNNEKDYDVAVTSVARITNILLAGSLIAFILGLVVSVFITRSVLRQLGGEPSELILMAGTIASGDLNGAIATGTHDQSSVVFAIMTMRDSLANIVGQVRGSTEAIATASAQIASGNLDLSSRTEEQASSLEETASSMEQLTSTVRQNADNARHANQLALSASQIAVQGGSTVREVIDTMGSINASAKKIVDIISVIDGIAFQTNILALNAAVEAARAGEQGRGFAVVASEVRNLAQRSASAAKEIKTLIDDSLSRVNAGSMLVDQAGVTMAEVVLSVKRVSEVISEITAASQEQTSGISQINIAITEMDEVTQQNAALVEQAAAAAEALQEQAKGLYGLVSVFKIDNHAESVTSRPARRLIGM